jgi:hypothetical protein
VALGRKTELGGALPFLSRQAVMVKIDATVNWQFAQDAETGAWIGVCPDFNLNAIGDTWLELQKAIAETMGLLLTDLFEGGELEAFLRQNGWGLQSRLPEPGRKVRFDVPLNVSRASAQELVPTGA